MMSQTTRAGALPSRSRFSVKAVSAVAACALAMGLCPALAFAEADEEGVVWTVAEGEVSEEEMSALPEIEAPADPLAEVADQLEMPGMHEEKTAELGGITYRYYVGDVNNQFGEGIYVTNTSAAATIVLPAQIENQNVVYVSTSGSEGLSNSEPESFAIDASKATALKSLTVYGPVKGLDLSASTALEYLEISTYSGDQADDLLSSLDVTKCAALSSLHVGGTQLTSLDLSGNPQLANLNCSGNRLSSLDTSKNPLLVSISCVNNRIVELNVSKNAELLNLQCNNNRLSTLDVSANPKLQQLICANNYLSTLDVSKNVKLAYLVCSNNDLRALDLSKNTQLSNLYCAYNRISDTKPLTEKYGTRKGIILPQKETTPAIRYAGSTALDTMAAISSVFPISDTVVVATMDGYWDALTASSLAGLNDCPIILTESKSLSPQSSLAIMNTKATKVYIAGGTAAISADVEAAIKSLENVETVERFAGDNAIGTSLKLYEKGKGSWSTTAIVATSGTFQDALSISPYAYANGAPIFLTNASTLELDAQVLKAVKEGGFTNVIIVGGEAAVSKQVEKQLDGIKCERLAGPTAYETSGAIAAWCLDQGMSVASVGVATGTSYYDALAGAALCGLNNSALVLVDDANRSNVDTFIKKNRESVRQVSVFGGPAAVSDATVAAVEAALK